MKKSNSWQKLLRQHGMDTIETVRRGGVQFNGRARDASATFPELGFRLAVERDAVRSDVFLPEATRTKSTQDIVTLANWLNWRFARFGKFVINCHNGAVSFEQELPLFSHEETDRDRHDTLLRHLVDGPIAIVTRFAPQLKAVMQGAEKAESIIAKWSRVTFQNERD